MIVAQNCSLFTTYIEVHAGATAQLENLHIFNLLLL